MEHLKKMPKSLKGYGIIRTLALMVLVMGIFMFGFLGFTGGFLVANNYPINATLKAQYLNIAGNNIAPTGSVFGSYGSLISQSQSQTNTLLNPNNTFGFVGSVQLGVKFFTSVPSIIGGIVAFVEIPLTAVGIPTSYAAVIVAALVIIMLVLAVMFILSLVPS